MARTPRYSSARENTIISFAFSDIASGKSYVIFYGGYGGAYFLTTSTNINSGYQSNATTNAGITTADVIETAFGIKLSINFDTKFDVAQTIDGDTFCNATIGINSNAVGDNETADVALTVSAQKNGVHLVSGATVLTEGSLNTGTNKHDSGEFAVVLDIPKTSFGIGDTLRFVVEVSGNGTSGDNLIVGIGHDPANRNEDVSNANNKTILDSQTTQMRFAVPFVPQI